MRAYALWVGYIDTKCPVYHSNTSDRKVSPKLKKLSKEFKPKKRFFQIPIDKIQAMVSNGLYSNQPSPNDLVYSTADEWAGDWKALAESGLVLSRYEFLSGEP